MGETGLLRDLVILFAAALPIVFVFQRLNIPSVVGFLIAGVVIGPHGLALIARPEAVNQLAEMGLIVLLFVAGLELSFGSLTRLRRVILWAGTLQIVITVAVVAALAMVVGLPAPLALFSGFVAAHSSTAIVIKMLADRGEMDAPQGHLAAGILLIQDLSLVPMILLTRLLAGTEAVSWTLVGATLVQATVAVAFIIVAARVVLPRVLRRIVQLRSRELFTGTIVLFSFGTAWLASALGLSLALGALIAGLVISESEYSHQAVADIVPFRDTLNSVFFISIGMLLHTEFLAHNWLPLVAGALGIMALKAVVLIAVILPFYPSVRIGLITAFTLAAAGEMAFVLAQFALPTGFLSASQYEAFVGIVALSMFTAPLLVSSAPALAQRLEHLVGTTDAGAPVAANAPEGHVLILGYGLNGENLARVLRQTGVRYLILELNPDRVTTARERGEQVLYGDASRLEVLEKAGVNAARVVVVAISDPVATRRIVALARQRNSLVSIIVRTRYLAEIDALRRLGATEVIPEEFETSVEIFSRVLRRLRVPHNIIALQIDLIRKESYGMLRGIDLAPQTLGQLDDILAATTTETFMVLKESPAAGRSIRQLGLRKATGVTIIAVVRDGRPSTNPSPDAEIHAGDILVLVGSHAQLDHAMSLLSGSPTPEGSVA